MAMTKAWRMVSGWVLALGVCAGCVGTRMPPVDEHTTRPFAIGVELSLSESGLSRGDLVDSANFGHLRQLWVRVNVPGMVPVGYATMRLINPHGEILYSRRLPFSYDPLVKTIPLEDGALAPVLTAKTVPGGYALDMSVPVLGTPLHAVATRGTWELQADVEGYSETLYRTFDVTHTR